MKNLNWLRERLIDKLGSAESVSGSSEGSGYWRGRADVLRESLLIVDSMRDGQVDRRAVWRKSVERFGRDKQSIVCMEECAELIQAISKLKRYNPEDPNNKVGRKELIENLYEEVADVLICIDLLSEIYGLKFGDVRRMIHHKVWRMKRRMEAQGAEL